MFELEGGNKREQGRKNVETLTVAKREKKLSVSSSTVGGDESWRHSQME